MSFQNQTRVVNPKDTQDVLATLWHPKIKDDPHAFVMFSFPWGKKYTPLERVEGPRVWQKDELNRIADSINQNHERIRKGDIPRVYKSATVSGRGPGKSALASWLNLWMLNCHLGSTSLVTANTNAQLVGKTFAEIGTWFAMSPLSNHLFERTQTKLTPTPQFAELMKKDLSMDWQYYYIQGILWDADKPDSFAGVHNPKGVMLTFDEASGIPAPIWQVSEGFFTDISPYRFWLAFSNPRSNTGPFFECFNRNREYWYNRKIDSRDVEGLDHSVLNQIVEQYGEDSDEARIEVKGEFPKTGDKQFISRSTVQDAQKRQLERYDDHAALLMGVDPARFGDDSTVISFRRGRDARSIPSTVMKGADNMQVANKVAQLIEEHDPDAIFIDAGAGAGIIDRLKERGYRRIHEVGFGTASSDPQYYDHRTELWGQMREWLFGALIPDTARLETDLCAPEYKFFGREDKKKLESKEEMKARGLSSPDNADALAVTFHLKVARRSRPGERPQQGGSRSRRCKGADDSFFS